jgi:hypothetical protein
MVTHVAWTKWIDVGEGTRASFMHKSHAFIRFNSYIKGQAIVAASDADGRISFFHANCRRSNDETPSRYPSVEFTQADSSEPIFIDRRAVTAMTWISLKDKTDVSVFLLALKSSP